ncbi:structural maintenance of chromosomes protein 2 [Leptopilina heterotoma]|uniref:structural maintenance of chromosomes protein 2 n=1 Tax=Leptopilina heterotoma TaxID=63436 RepID=UPI001CA7BDD7|nr:structural maintenance of chromosomes protein 2 [Leptopilina heterotoma]
MYIKSMVLEGFKSYGKRIEINGFDREFNAITGLNGSGKSNILDGICFVLGITNLSQVRASSLQELVYKSGQAGIKKASVTITFDNRNRDVSPMGYEHYDEITITRQVIIGGKNKYMINGSNVPNKRVQDLFCSVQLNVNNPHFLIMQGRITKVLNMKPMEILSMIEEAAGTRMYETKKQAALKTIEKKDSKLVEIENILKEEIGPKLERLKQERMQFVEFQRVERELEHCRRIYIAWRYQKALQDSDDAEKNVSKVKKDLENKQKSIKDGEEEVKRIEIEVVVLQKKRDEDKGLHLETLESNLKEVEKKELKLAAEIKGNKENVKTETTALEQLKSNITDDEKMLTTKEKQLEKVGGLFQQLKDQDQQDSDAFLAAQETYHKISAGLLENDDGENATLEQQLMNAKQTATQAQTEVKQCEMTLSHSKQQLTKKQNDMRNTENDYKKDSKKLTDVEQSLQKIENELKSVNYTEGELEGYQERRRTLQREIGNLQDKVDVFESRCHQLRFNYKDPEPNFRRESVKGLVCQLITLRDHRSAYALEVAAGGKLYNVIVDTENTSKKLLQRGQLQQRVTIIPLNKINGRVIDKRIVDLAQKLVGKENVQPALNLIDFPEETRSAMNWIFGQVFICKDMETARKIAFHDGIMKKCVTLDGDVFDPSGTLSGGSRAKGGSILLKLEELKVIQNELNQKNYELRDVEGNISNIGQNAQKYTMLKQTYDLKSHEVEMVRKRIQQTTHHQIKEEVEALQASIVELTQKMKEAKETEKLSSQKSKELEAQLKDSANIRERQLKEAEKKLETLRKKSEASRKEWQKREQESEMLNLELSELKKTIESGKEQLEKAEAKLNELKEKESALKEEINTVKEEVAEVQGELKKQKDIINQKSKEIQKMLNKKEELIKQASETELEIKKLNHEINAIKNSATECKHKVAELKRKYEWIEQDKDYFGEAGGMYDFSVNDPEKMGQKMHQLENQRDRLSRNVNTRAMNLLNKEEEQYKMMLDKKKIVENDKRKILETIKHLDEKKKETIHQAWEQVNKDFGSIFSTLLPGTSAKLQPPENSTVLDGLEVKIAFSGVWKESLGELSGGQKSLVALSLILAMLLFKPAPLYILDEVDAALDLSHTENIGTMLKRHFKHSQFVLVSLKDGMFNNANVLFTTKFVDGMSTISRTERSSK